MPLLPSLSESWAWAFPSGSGIRYRSDYLCHLADRFRLLPAYAQNPEAALIAKKAVERADKIAADGVRAEPASVSWREIHAFEQAFVALLPDDALEEEASHLLLRATEFCGPARAAAWRTASLLTAQPVNPAAVRQSLLRVLTDAQQAQIGTRAVEHTRLLSFVRASLIIVVLVGVVGLVALGLKGIAEVGSWWGQDWTVGPLPQIVSITFMGALGAGISKLLRITSIPADARPEIVGVQLKQLRGEVLAAMLIGAAAASVLFFAYAGGLLDVAGIFPQVADGELPAGSSRLSQFLSEPFTTRPALAKALFWSFIAGFSERFFQDTVDRLVGRATASTTTP